LPDEYTEEYARRGSTRFRSTSSELVFVVKRFYKPQWAANWREHFSVEIINGVPSPRTQVRRIASSCRIILRVGYDQDGSWRTFGPSQGFSIPPPSSQLEDDITASIVVPSRSARKAAASDYTGKAVSHEVRQELRIPPLPAARTTPSIAATTSQTEADLSRSQAIFSPTTSR
jgi:hypothetical protein